jgi:hypothetical protein
MKRITLEEHLRAIKSPGNTNPAWKGVADTMHAFAAFLAELAEETESFQLKLAKKAESLQRKLTRLTWVLLIATIGLLLIAALQTAKMFLQ